MKESGQYFTSDSAEDTACRLYGQVRQLYYLHRDQEAGIPVDRETLSDIINSILYIALHTEKHITENSVPGKTQRMKMETRGGVIPVYNELKKNLDQYYKDLRSYSSNRIKKI